MYKRVCVALRRPCCEITTLRVSLASSGSFGDDYEALNRRTKSICVVKVVDTVRYRPESILREFNVLERVGQHPSIVTYLGAFRDKGCVCFCMERWGSGRLFDRLTKRGPLTEEQARSGFRGLGEALVYLHERGVIHRDLKVRISVSLLDCHSLIRMCLMCSPRTSSLTTTTHRR